MFGAVLRPEGFNATLVSLDTGAAEKIPDVKVVREGDFIGVVAPERIRRRSGRAQSTRQVERSRPAIESRPL